MDGTVGEVRTIPTSDPSAQPEKSMNRVTKLYEIGQPTTDSRDLKIPAVRLGTLFGGPWVTPSSAAGALRCTPTWSARRLAFTRRRRSLSPIRSPLTRLRGGCLAS